MVEQNSDHLEALRELLRRFATDRNWEQFHTPRNLLLALVGEVGELAELFQWISDEQAAIIMQDPDLGARVGEELADVFGYVVRLADILGIDLYEALTAKVKLNAQRYPVDLARGKATKYTELHD
jgi:dCTP diphosphatase